MAKITIAIEDCDDGLLIVGDPSMNELITKARTAPKSLSMAEFMALAAWEAIASTARMLGDVQTGERQ